MRIAPIEIIEVNAPPVAQAMSFKGQLISERNFGVFNSPKKEPNSWMISALASKMGKIKSINALYLSIMYP